MKKIILVITLFGSFHFTVVAQNLLEKDYKNWSVGTGSTVGFSQNGGTSENSREYGTGPFGNNVLLWKAKPDSGNNADGGWNGSYHKIDHTKDYRFSVWIKKTNSNYGYTYLGCNSYNNILRLNGSIENNPYFFVGDLPALNKWYLLVGYVHKSSYTGTTNIGGIYDPSTGAKVRTLTSFKFKSSATTVRHRSYLYYDTNTNDRQYFYAPRMEQVNGSEPSITKMLGRAMANKLVFIYDSAGNQKIRRAPNNSSGTPSLRAELPDQIVTNTTDDEEIVDEINLFEETIVIFPNPTSGDLNMQWNSDYNFLIQEIIVSDMSGRRVPINHSNGSQEVQVDLTRYPTGVYLVNFLLKDGRSVQKKIIKK